MHDKSEDKLSKQEAQRRLEAALRGARIVGHKPLKDIKPDQPKPRTTGKGRARVGKSKS